MYGDHDPGNRRRLTAAAATLAVHGVIAAGLLWGLAVHGEKSEGDPPLTVTTIRVDEPPEPPPPEPEKPSPAPEQEAAPEAARNEALPKEAPPAAIPLSPTPAATVAGSGRDASQGAGERGNGQGAGGDGEGTGGGGAGMGTPARRIAGALRDSDYPREAEAQRLSGTVAIAFRVRTDGRVDRCSVTRSSGHALLDNLTCRLFSERYRFAPATDGRGEPIESTLQTNFTWSTRRR